MKIFAKLDAGDVVYDIQERHTGTGIIGSLFILAILIVRVAVESKTTDLVSKPDTLRTTLLLFLWVLFCPPKQEDESVDWSPDITSESLGAIVG